MDKSQKQLIDTYFRKRNIGLNPYRSLQNYEIVYALRNDIKIDLSIVKTNLLAKLVSENPDLINKIDSTIFNIDDVLAILVNENGFGLYKHFGNRINKWYGNQLEDLLYNKPEYVDILDMSRLRGDNIKLLLRHRPNLVSKLDLSKLNSGQIEDVLFHRPELEKYFNNNHNG